MHSSHHKDPVIKMIFFSPNKESTDCRIAPGVNKIQHTYYLWTLYSCTVGEMYCAPILAKQEELLSENIVFIRPPVNTLNYLTGLNLII